MTSTNSDNMYKKSLDEIVNTHKMLDAQEVSLVGKFLLILQIVLRKG